VRGAGDTEKVIKGFLFRTVDVKEKGPALGVFKKKKKLCPPKILLSVRRRENKPAQRLEEEVSSYENRKKAQP